MQPFPIRKLANAFIPNATASAALGGQARRVTQRLSRKSGGLWVGGAVEMSASGLCFTPNELNRTLHAGLEPVSIPSSDVLRIGCESGWITDIVVVTHAAGVFRFRCYGAKQLAAALADLYGAP